MTVNYMQAIRARYESLGYIPYRWFEADSACALTSADGRWCA